MKSTARTLPWNLTLAVIGVIDLATTLIWLHEGRVVESNPIMAPLLSVSLPLFAFVKLSTICAYIVVMEWYRRRRSPAFARTVSMVTVAAYVGVYIVSFCSVNHGIFFR